ncbi:MAG: hypothetical protein ACFB2W_14720 [Leptolyngbyaceae cyanobacterium]
MATKLFTGGILGIVSLIALVGSSHASSGGPITVDAYGSSYSVELDSNATNRVLRNQPWWGNRELASELCEALVYQGQDIASVGFNTMEISGENYIAAYLVMPSTTCSGPVVIAPEDIGQRAGGTFFVVTGNVCLSSKTNVTDQGFTAKTHQPVPTIASIVNCDYFDRSMLY